jgi:aquaporin Z
MEKNDNAWQVPWRLFISELVGTAVLLLGGLSIVIFMFGTGSPMEGIIPSVKIRQMATGFLFGSVGTLITLSTVGKESGAHINPAVSLAFWMFQKLDTRTALVYALAQLVGAGLGCLPLLAWGSMGRSVAFGATLPGKGYAIETVLMGEAVTTFALVTALCLFIGFRRIRPFTPFMIPFLYAVMVPLEASISGTSTNPARTIGPALISGQWEGWWIYWAGPLAGTLVAVLVCSSLARRIEVAKLYHFESDRRRIFHRMAGSR